MRQTGIVLLGIVFLFLGRFEALGLAQEQGMGNSIFGGSSFLNSKDYRDYAKAVRIKIGDNMSKRHDELEAGAVSLDFEISSEGKLIQVRIDNEKTNASSKMENIAINAVRESSPFGPFPEALAKGYHQLPFHIKLEYKNQ